MTEYKDKLFEKGDAETNIVSQDTETQKNLRAIYDAIPSGCNSLMAEPVFEKNLMFVVSSDSHVYAIDYRKGQVIWKFRTGGFITHTPALYAGTIFFGSQDHHLYAIDARSGEEKWRFRTGDFVQVKPLVLSDRIVFGSFDGNIYAVSHDGQLLWKIKLSGFSIDEPLYVNGTIYVGATDGRLHAIRASDGKELWSYFAASTYVGVPAYVRETTAIVFMTWDGYVCDITQGQKLRWKFKCDGSIPLRFRWEIKDSVLYVGAGDLHSGAVYALDEQYGRLLWRFQTGGRVQGTCACKGMMLCSSLDKNLYALGTDGKLVWKFQADGSLYAPAVCHDGLIFQCSSSGHVYCLTETGELVWKIFFPGQPVVTERFYSPVQSLADRVRSIFRWWKPEKAVSRAYETKAQQPQLSLGPAAYKMSEPYKAGVGYKMEGPPGYEMHKEKKKDWWADPWAR